MNLLLKVLIVLSMIAVMVACETKKDMEKEHLRQTKVSIQEIRYVKDKRTNLCFAVYNEYRHYGLALVDCKVVESFLLE